MRGSSGKLYDKRHRIHRKLEVLQSYGGQCVCCGEKNPTFLTMEHSRKDGAEHRKMIGHKDFYVWLKKHGCPKDLELEILCWNCNLARHIDGICPHELDRKVASTTPHLDALQALPESFEKLVTYAQEVIALRHRPDIQLPKERS